MKMVETTSKTTKSTGNAKPSVSIVIPAHNESAIFLQNINLIYEYMESLSAQYDWEIVMVNDGSKDDTGALADKYAETHDRFCVKHHKVNLYLGCALRTGFRHSKGDYIVTMDLDLSYSPDHIERLLDTITQTEAQIVIASPYMKGGKVSNVPFLRKFMSRAVNFFLAFFARENIHTFTGMVRAYNRKFINTLNLKARDFEINPEIIYKSLLLRARIVEIPAHLDWVMQNSVGKSRVSNLRMLRGIMSGFMSGFIFRPYFFFIFVGLILLLISLYVLTWIFINTFNVYATVPVMRGVFDDRFSTAVSMVFNKRPHAFFVGGITLIVSLQFLSLGFLSLQSKRYFEELFHLNTNLLKISKRNDDVSLEQDDDIITP